MLKFDYYAVIKAFYILMNADGLISPEELNKYNEIVDYLEQDNNITGLNDFKKTIVNDFENKVNRLSTDDDYYSFLLNEINEALCFSDNESSSHELPSVSFVAEKIITPRWLLWNMLAIAYSNDEYHKNEKGIMAHIAEKTDTPTSILLEMEQYVKAIHSIEEELDFVIRQDGLYSVIRPIVDELEYRKNAILQNALQLIQEEEQTSIERIEVTKNAYSRAIDSVKEKAAPMTDAVSDKTTEFITQTKEKVSQSEFANEVGARAQKITDTIKTKVKETEVTDKVGNFIKKFKNN